MVVPIHRCTRTRHSFCCTYRCRSSSPTPQWWPFRSLYLGPVQEQARGPRLERPSPSAHCGQTSEAYSVSSLRHCLPLLLDSFRWKQRQRPWRHQQRNACFLLGKGLGRAQSGWLGPHRKTRRSSKRYWPRWHRPSKSPVFLGSCRLLARAPSGQGRC
jgi:hypothetical protein